MTATNTLRIGEVARLCGVSPDTVRHYEKCGLLSNVARTSNGYRLYSEADVRRVLLIRNALTLGFHLRELTEILKRRDAGHLPCRTVRETAVQKLASVDVQIEEMKRFREQLHAVIDDWNKRLERGDPDSPAHLLESLVTQTNGGENHEDNHHRTGINSPDPGNRRSRSFRRLPRIRKT